MIGYCSNCDTKTNGESRGKQYKCNQCGKYTTKKAGFVGKKFSTDGCSAQYVITSEERIITEEDVIKVGKIDTKIWKIDKIEIGSSEGYRKDRKVSWHVSGGNVISGDVEDSGKILVVPLHSVRVWLSRRTEEIRNDMIVKDFTSRAVKFSPKYKSIKYRKKSGNVFEIGLPDLQLGRLVAGDETGNEISPDEQIKEAERVIDKLLSYSGNFGIDRVLFPVGNDYFDTNSAEMYTKHGTPQEDDIRWKRTYQLGCKFIVNTIDKLMQIAPVDVLIIPGNHDEDKIWYMGEYMQAWYRNCKNVSVDNRKPKRKYYQFGSNLIGFTHGYFEKNNKLDSLMAYEVPNLWARTSNREWHLGDKHHKVDMVLKTDEFENGVVVRILRSLASPSIWEFDKGYVGSLKAAEAFVWDEKDGVVAQLTAKK